MHHLDPFFPSLAKPGFVGLAFEDVFRRERVFGGSSLSCRGDFGSAPGNFPSS
jgi:hypothetical protein